MCRDESRRERQLSSHIRSGLLVGRSDATIRVATRHSVARAFRSSRFGFRGFARPPATPPPVVIFSNSCSAAPSPYRYLGTQTL